MSRSDREMAIFLIVVVVVLISGIWGFVKFIDTQNANTYRQQATRCQELAETYGYTWKYDSLHTCLFETQPDV